MDAFFSYFERGAALINEEFATVAKCTVYANFPPEDSPNHGFFGLFADCLLRGVAWDHSDNVGILIGGSDFDEKVTIHAELSWGESPSHEFPDPVELNDRSLGQIREKLPYMFKKLRELISLNPGGSLFRRGKIIEDFSYLFGE